MQDGMGTMLSGRLIQGKSKAHPVWDKDLQRVILYRGI